MGSADRRLCGPRLFLRHPARVVHINPGVCAARQSERLRRGVLKGRGPQRRQSALRALLVFWDEVTPISCKKRFNRAQMSDVLSDIMSLAPVFSYT